MNLQAYPRPKGDNGIGIHFRLDLRETDNKPYITQGVSWAQSIHAKWALVAGQDSGLIMKAAVPLWQAGIMPVCRWIVKVDGSNYDHVLLTKLLLAAGIPPYIQIFNEPGDDREWNHKPDIATFGAKWAQIAANVFDAGGYPGVGAVLGQNEWQAAFNSLNTTRPDVWKRAWFCVHNYGSNHPPNYPYDVVNQRGTPVTQEEYAASEFSLPIDEVNALRASSAKPGATVLTDDTCLLRFLEFKAWMVESLGYCLPMIGGEGGWEWGSEEDNRYPKISAQTHAAYTKLMFQQFATGILENGDPLPDELFSLAPWVMADWGADDWWFGTLGTKQGTIDAVASIPPFVRQFAGTPTPVPLPVPPPVPPPLPPPAGQDPRIICDEPVPFLTLTDDPLGRSRILKVYCYNAKMAQGRTRMDWRVQTPDGKDANMIEVDLDNGGNAKDWTENGNGSFQMGDNGGFLVGRDKHGPYTVSCPDITGSKVEGLGDPDHVHWIFLIIFEVPAGR